MVTSVKVALYVRVSTQEQAKEGYSIGEQTDRLTKYAQAHDWVIFNTYVDAGFSGANMERPALKQMLADVKKGGIDKVIVYKLDRLSRSQKDTLSIIEDQLLKNNCDFESMTEKFDTSTAFGKAMVGILAVFAQLEREQIKERLTMGLDARVKEGKWRGGAVVPFGYDYDPQLGYLIINEYNSLIVKEIFEQFASGKNIRRIQADLNEKGFMIHNGKCSTYAIRYVLANKTYIGYLRNKDTWKKGLHEPIIDEETFNKCQQRLEANREKDRQKTPGNYSAGCRIHVTALGGLLYCKQCGARFSKVITSHKGNHKYVYECYSRHKKVTSMIKDPNCKNKIWQIKDLDEIIFNEINKLAIDPDYIQSLLPETNNEDKAIKGLNKRINEINGQISKLMDLYSLGSLTIDEIGNKIEPLKVEQEKLNEELTKIKTPKLSDKEVIKIAKSFKQILKKGELEDIRSVIEALIDYIEIDNDDIFIHWNFQ